MKSRISRVITVYLPQCGTDHAMNHPPSSENSVLMTLHEEEDKYKSFSFTGIVTGSFTQSLRQSH